MTEQERTAFIEQARRRQEAYEAQRRAYTEAWRASEPEWLEAAFR